MFLLIAKNVLNEEFDCVETVSFLFSEITLFSPLLKFLPLLQNSSSTLLVFLFFRERLINLHHSHIVGKETPT